MDSDNLGTATLSIRIRRDLKEKMKELREIDLEK